MTLRAALERFDKTLLAVYPEGHASLAPGLRDDQLDDLRRAILPMELTADLEELYRWHNGSTLRIVCGGVFLSVEALLKSRAFEIQELGHPPAWLHLTDGPAYHFATLNVPGSGTEPAVWQGDTHDMWLCRMHDSLEALFLTLGDIAADESVAAEDRRKHLDGLGPRWMAPHRLRNSPGSFAYPDPPTGTYISVFPEPDWPRQWLVSLGATGDELLPKGGTTPIAELTSGDLAAATVAGEVIRLTKTNDWTYMAIQDSSGILELTVDNSRTVLSPIIRTWVEADIEQSQPGSWTATALRRQPAFP
jgi:hypothetical protein